jgi:site-specific recombinase XerD
MSNPSKVENRCTPLAEWPAADRAAWSVAQQPHDLLEPAVGYASRWRPTTQKMIENGYGRWVGWLGRSGQLDPCSTPADRADRPRVTAYLQSLHDAGLADFSVAARLQQLGNALRAMAPGHDWTWLLRASSRVHAQATPARDPAARMPPAAEVKALGVDMMYAAENDRFRTERDRAALFRDGLLITLLFHRSLRLGNLTNIVIGRQLQRQDDGWRLVFNETGTKGNNPINWPWPAELTSALERYIDVHREVLLRCSRKSIGPTQALWISKQGTVMTTSAISFQISGRTEAEFGKAINPHSFRHLGGTTIATYDPDHATDIRLILGHTSMKTSEKFYNHAKMIDAGRLYEATLAALKDET